MEMSVTQFWFKTKNSDTKSELLLWAETESNRRHMDFQSIALPTELSAHIVKKLMQK